MQYEKNPSSVTRTGLYGETAWKLLHGIFNREYVYGSSKSHPCEYLPNATFGSRVMHTASYIVAERSVDNEIVFSNYMPEYSRHNLMSGLDEPKRREWLADVVRGLCKYGIKHKTVPPDAWSRHSKSDKMLDCKIARMPEWNACSREAALEFFAEAIRGRVCAETRAGVAPPGGVTVGDAFVVYTALVRGVDAAAKLLDDGRKAEIIGVADDPVTAETRAAIVDEIAALEAERAEKIKQVNSDESAGVAAVYSRCRLERDRIAAEYAGRIADLEKELGCRKSNINHKAA